MKYFIANVHNFIDFNGFFTSLTLSQSKIHSKSSTSCIVVVSSNATPTAPSSKYLKLIFFSCARAFIAEASCSETGTICRVSK